MPSVYQLKPAFQNLLRPVVRGLAGAGVTPNQVTVLALVLSVLTGAAVVWQPGARWVLFVVPVVLVVRMALNAIDGVLAREFGMTSRAGAVLNELGDVVADAAMYLPLGLVAGFDARLVTAVVVLGVVAEMTGVLAQALGGARRYDGPMGKSDRAFAFGALSLLLALGVERAWVFDAVLALVVVLSCVTVVNRARAAVRGGD